jgi:hypothetical protein
MNIGAQVERQLLAEMEMEWLEELRRELLLASQTSKLPQLQFVNLELTDSDNQLGKWDSRVKCISISRNLVRNFAWDCVLGVLLHEMAHAVVSLVFKSETSPHGDSFLQACELLHVPPEFRSATVDLTNPGNSVGWRNTEHSEDCTLLRRAEKLSQLAESQNQHEASLALERLQRLRTSFNWQRALKNSKNTYVKLTLRPRKKALSKVYKKLAAILNEFYGVHLIFSTEFCAEMLETYKTMVVLGARHEVLFAEYVYFSLLQQLNALGKEFLKQSKQNENFGSRSDLLTFQFGLLVGFAKKLRGASLAPEEEFGANGVNSSALTVVDAYEKNKNRELKNYVRKHFPKLVSSRTGTKITNSSVYHAGIEAGGRVSIHKPVTSKNSGKLLSN